MIVSDPIADMLTRIRNASLVKLPEVLIPHSKMKERIAQLLMEEGWIETVAARDEDRRPMLALGLKYEADGNSVIRKIVRVSKPGRRLYVKRGEIPTVLSNFGIALISTSAGIMTNREARKRHLGGEVICEIY